MMSLTATLNWLGELSARRRAPNAPPLSEPGQLDQPTSFAEILAASAFLDFGVWPMETPPLDAGRDTKRTSDPL